MKKFILLSLLMLFSLCGFGQQFMSKGFISNGDGIFRNGGGIAINGGDTIVDIHSSGDSLIIETKGGKIFKAVSKPLVKGDTLDLIATQDFVNNAIDGAGFALGQSILFLHSEASDIVGYNQLLTIAQEDPEATNNAVVNSVSGSVVIQEFATQAMNLNVIPGGVWTFMSWFQVDAGTGNTTVTIRVYKRSSLGVETELFNVTTPELNSVTPAEVDFETVQSDFNVDLTDRIVVKYFAQTTSGGNRTVTLYYEGNARYTHIHTPIVIGSTIDCNNLHSSISASNNGQLDCVNATVILTAQSNQPVTWQWDGSASGDLGTDQTAVLFLEETVTLTVTNTETGCTTDTSITITLSNTTTGVDIDTLFLPGAIGLRGRTAGNSEDLRYYWTGTGLTNYVKGPLLITSNPGSYTLHIYDNSNECTEFDFVTLTASHFQVPTKKIFVDTLIVGNDTIVEGSIGGENNNYITDTTLYMEDPISGGFFEIRLSSYDNGIFEFYWTNPDNSKDVGFKIDSNSFNISRHSGVADYEFAFDTTLKYLNNSYDNLLIRDNSLITKSYADANYGGGGAGFANSGLYTDEDTTKLSNMNNYLDHLVDSTKGIGIALNDIHQTGLYIYNNGGDPTVGIGAGIGSPIIEISTGNFSVTTQDTSSFVWDGIDFFVAPDGYSQFEFNFESVETGYLDFNVTDQANTKNFELSIDYDEFRVGSTGSNVYEFIVGVNGIITKQLSGSLTDGTPTAAEITAIVGVSATLAGAGFQVTIKDTDGTGLLYKVESDGTDWFYTVMTKAL